MHPLRILLVEDSPDDAEMILLALRRGGLDPVWSRVENAAELSAALSAESWNVILSDFSMPGFGAQAALEIVRDFDREIPFLVVSGTVGEETAVGMMLAGANDYFLKGALTRLAPAVDREVRQAANRRAIRRSELAVARLAAIVDSSDDAIISKTLDGIVTSWNPAAERLYGWTAEEAIGRHISFIVPADKTDEFAGLVERLRRGEKHEQFETVQSDKRGRRHDVSITASTILNRNGQLAGVSIVSRDITARKRAEASLREKETRLAQAVQIARLGYWSRDLTTQSVRWSDELYEIFGVTPSTFGHTYETFVATLHPDDRPAVERRIADAVAKVESFDHIYRIFAHGELKVIHELGRVVAAPDGSPIEVIGTAQDISERTRAEQRLTIQHLVVGILAQARDLREAAPDLLRAVCETAGWDMGVLWMVDQQVNELTFVDLWHVESCQAEGFRNHCRTSSFAPRTGLPGHVWSEGRVISVANLSQERRLPRAPAAESAGLRSWFCVPVLFGSQVLGVVEFYNRESRQPDKEQLRMFESLGSQLGQFIERKRVEAGLILFRTLIDHSMDGIEVLDPATGRFLDVNERTCVSHGYSREELLGMELSTIAPETTPRILRTLLEAGRSDKPGITEDWHRRKDGSTFPVEVSTIAIRLDRDYLLAIVRDTTERKKGEATLRLSEERYRTLISATSSIVWHTPSSGEFETEQPGWTAFTGQTFDQLKGWGWLNAIHPEDRSNTAAVWSRAVAERTPYEVEHRMRRANGEYRQMSVRAVPILDRDGSIREWIGVHSDIHEQKRAEFERAELLSRLTLQIERMPLAYLLSGPNFHYTRWNPAAERIFGFSEAEVLGRHPFEVIVPHVSQPLVKTIFARLAAGDMNAHGVSENLTKDGRIIVCEWHNTPLFSPDGTFQGILSLAQDITARRAAEKSLHLRDRAIQAVSGGLTISDATQVDCPLIYVNPGFQKLTGYTEAEVIGLNCRFLQGAGTDPATVARIRSAVAAGEGCTVEILNYRKNGTSFWNELSISPVHDADGRLTHFVGVESDVTARRSLEEQFRQAQKMEAVGQLAGGVAHDFNNLLTIINGYSDLLATKLPPLDPLLDLVSEIQKAGERSAGLTRQLLAFSRQQILAPKVLDLNEIVIETEKMLRRLLGEDIRLNSNLQPQPWPVRADPGQLDQVLMNLAVNARDAMPRGGRLTIETRNVELDEGYTSTQPEARAGRHVLLSVSDNGCGIPPEVKRRIFEPFFTTKGQGKGTGLGLATVYGIIKQSGGHLAVYSEVGVGTTFKVYLPAVEEPAGRTKALSTIKTPPRGNETILLAEDEDGVRGLIRHVLRGCGYTVLEAADGEEASQIANRFQGTIQLLITDVVMPGIGGRGLSEQLTELNPSLKILFVSGYTDDAVVRHGVLLDGVDFLQKPFSPIALAIKVREVLDRATPAHLA